MEKKKVFKTKKGTIPNKPNRNKLKRIKATKKKVVRTGIDIVEDNLRTKVFSGKELSASETSMLEIISKKFMEENKKQLKHSWDIELSTYLNGQDSTKKYFLIKSKFNKDIDFNWIASDLAQAHIDTICKSSKSKVTLFKSKKFWIEADLEAMVLSLKNLKDGKLDGIKHIKKYTLEDLPLFKNVIETMK